MDVLLGFPLDILKDGTLSLCALSFLVIGAIGR